MYYTHPKVIPWERTDKWTNKQTNKRTNIYSIFRDKLLFPHGSLDIVLNASPGAAIFGQDMLFDIPFIADWKINGEHRQRLADFNTARENEGKIDYDYKVGQKILVCNKGILRQAQTIWQKDPWTITTVHTNGTITIQFGNL
jgi:hypothetical protein